MFISIPVECNVGMAVGVVGSTRPGYINPAPRKLKPSAWQHPGHTTDTRRMIAAVACGRELVTRSTAAAMCQTPATNSSVLACAVQLADKWDLVAYCVDVDTLGEELSARGPVLGALRVYPCLTRHISGIVDGSVSPDVVYTGSGSEVGLVSVAVLGECEGGYRVALPWGKFTKAMVGAHPWDGCVRVPGDMLVNLVSMLPVGAVSPAATPISTRELMVMPPEWSGPTTLPLPAATPVPPTRGKNSALKGKERVKGNGRAVRGKISRAPRGPIFTEARIAMGVNGMVVGTIVALLVLVLVAMKTRRH